MGKKDNLITAGEFVEEIQFQAFTHEKVKGNITLHKGRYVQGNGITVDVEYSIPGFKYFNGGSTYEDASDVRQNALNIAKKNLEEMIDGSFDVRFENKGEEKADFEVKTTPNFNRELRRYHNKKR